jgi:hypothetical protein
MMMEKLVEWLAGATEVLGENLPQCRFVHNKPHMLPGREPGPPDRLSYGTAYAACKNSATWVSEAPGDLFPIRGFGASVC